MIYPVILCGGSGTRLWPLSRKSYPKQFLDLLDSGETLLQSTCSRLKGLEEVGPITAVCNNENRFLVAQQLLEKKVSIESIMLEPAARNTAPAIACAALQLLKKDSNAILLVLPSDHVIEDQAALHAAIVKARVAAEQGNLVTFGVKPTHAETGYGYIKSGESYESGGKLIERFVEKPDAPTASAYFEQGGYSWNSGMFVFTAQAYIDQLGALRPEMLAKCKDAVDKARIDLDFICLDEQSFMACESDSVDYAVMEDAEKRVVVELDAGWNDLGSWSSLYDIGAKDTDNNCESGEVLSIDSSDNILKSSGRLIATLGISNLAVVDTDDALLIADRDRVQDVKKIVEKLQDEQRPEANTHSTVYRPWGAYSSICQGPRFQVKRIVVHPGQKLSLQKHHHRAEHWIVVKGTARVSCEDKVFELTEDQSTYIPLGHKHRLENPGKIPLELIEVQSGSYLGEDDIVRFDDVYGRKES